MTQVFEKSVFNTVSLFRFKKLNRLLLITCVISVIITLIIIYFTTSRSSMDAKNYSDNNYDHLHDDIAGRNVSLPQPSLSYNVHAFYYIWYGNIKFDGEYLHWNHQTLPHWEASVRVKYPDGIAHAPPDDIASSFYPSLGAYSSQDPIIIDDHMRQTASANIGVLVVSWFPSESMDKNGKPVDHIIPLLLEAANRYAVKIIFHLEPYTNRTVEDIRKDIKYCIDEYSPHPAFFRDESTNRPMFYLYDSYLIPSEEWQRIFLPTGDITLRNTRYDSTFIGLIVEAKHINDLSSSGFDGAYTYFAADRFSFGSSQKNWPSIARSCRDKGLVFIPSVGPGYIDVSVRPWNAVTSRERRSGRYYEVSWSKGLALKPKYISITSFNEWHEGTQIERAKPHATYLNYLPNEENYYLQLTAKYIDIYRKQVIY